MESLQTAVNVAARMFLMLALGCLPRVRGLLDRAVLERLNNVCFKGFRRCSFVIILYATLHAAEVLNPRLLGFALLLQLVIWGVLFLVIPRWRFLRPAALLGKIKGKTAPC